MNTRSDVSVCPRFKIAHLILIRLELKLGAELCELQLVAHEHERLRASLQRQCRGLGRDVDRVRCLRCQ